MAFIVRVLFFIGSRLAGFGSRIISLLGRIHNIGIMGIFKILKEGIKKILQHSITFTGWMVLAFEALKKLLGVIGLGTAIGSGALGVKQIFDFGRAVLDPQEQMLDWLADAFSNLPSIQGLIANLDSFMTGITSPYFTPPVTFTYLLQVTGVGMAFNQILQALISTLIFIFSIWLVKWAFTQNFTFTKSVP